MTLDLQFKIKNNQLYLKYLHENSNWYKLLNRNPLNFNDFIMEMKTNYKLRPQDKIDKILNTLDVINTIMEMK